MSKVLNYAGISRVAGELKFRTATEDSRFLQLVKLGDTEVEFVKITPVTTKQEAAQALLDAGFQWDKPEVLRLLQGVAGKVAKPKVERTVKVKAKKVKTVAPVADVKMSSKEAEKVRAEFMKKLKAAYEAA